MDYFNEISSIFKEFLARKRGQSTGEVTRFALTVLAGTVFSVVLLQWLQKRVKRLVGGKLPPGPTNWPFVGCIPNLWYMRRNRSNYYSWHVYQDLAKAYNSNIIYSEIGGYGFLILNDFESVEKALVEKPFDAVFSDRASFIPIMRGRHLGVIQSSGNQWKMHRRFTMQTMRDFGMGKKLSIESRIMDEVSHLLDHFSTIKSFEPKRLLPNGVSNIICNIIFGRRFDYDDAEFRNLVELSEAIFNRDFMDMLSGFLPGAWMLARFLPQSHDIDRVGKNIHAMVAKYLEEHKQSFNPDYPRDFLDIYLKNEANNEATIPLENFNAIINDLFLAGTETTSTALSWSFLILCKYPEIAKKIRAEITEQVGNDRLVSLEDKPKLVYCEAFMWEMFRYIAFTPMAVFHGLWEETQFEGYTVPARTLVAYNTYAIQHDAKYWGDPEVFRPERFIVDGKLKKEPRMLIFGIGKRKCLGESLALSEYHLMFCNLIQRFEFSLPDEFKDIPLTDGIPGVTITPFDHTLNVTPI